jgi:hypothetical protein
VSPQTPFTPVRSSRPISRVASTPTFLAAAIETAGYDYKTREQGAATSVLVAASPLLEGVSGRYFADCNEAPVVDSSFTGPPRGFGVASYALDPAAASRLWDLSLDLIGTKR